MLKTCKLTYTFKIKKNLWVQPLAKCSTTMKSNIENNNVKFSNYETKILQLINNGNLKKLTKFISAPYAETLIWNCTSNGPYNSLNDILLKTKMDVDILNNFFNSFINYNMKQKWYKFVKPDIKATTLPATILGIHVGPTAITWTLIDHHFKVLDWNCIIWQNRSLTITLYDIINLIPSFVQQLPLSSSYVMEEVEIKRKSYRTLFMQQQITICIASCIKLIINQRPSNSNSSEDILYILKSLTTARFFNLLVGSEVIAVNYIMKKLLNDIKVDDENLRDVYIASKLKEMYTRKNASEREQMGWSLLKTLACLHIVRNYIS